MIQGSILSKAQQQTSTLLPSFQRAAELKRAGGGKAACFHGLRFRINHLTGGAVAAATVVGATEKDVRNGNARRFQEWQLQLETLVSSFTKRVL